MQIEFNNITTLTKEEQLQILEWRNRDFIREKMLNQNIISKEEHLVYCKNLTKDKSNLVYRVSINKIPCGVINYTKLDYTNKIGEFGIYVLDKSRRIGICVGRLAIYYYFEVLNFSELRIRVLSSNKRAILYFEKLLFFSAPYLYKKEFIINGSSIDIIHYSMSYRHWNNVVKNRYMDTICHNSLIVDEKPENIYYRKYPLTI